VPSKILIMEIGFNPESQPGSSAPAIDFEQNHNISPAVSEGDVTQRTLPRESVHNL
jgi:hypothetical protein